MSAATSSGSSSWPAGGDPLLPDWNSVRSIGRFEVLRFLGQGGMGVVFLVKDNERGEGTRGGGSFPAPPTSGRGPAHSELALKLLRPEFSARRAAVERFLKEATHMQRLSHEFIVPVFAYGESELGPWLTMPYLERGTLDRLLRAEGPLAKDAAVGVAYEVASALAHAHHHGLVHRDVKPANVLLTHEGRAQLADFGLVHTLFNDSLLDIRSGIVAGTPRYQPPNALRGQHGDTRDDIWSYGVLLYEMLTGTVPYPGTTREEVLRQIESGPPRPPLQVNPEADEALTRTAMKAMTAELADRYASMDYVLEDLERARCGQSPKSPAPQETGAPRSVGRKRFAVAASAVALVCVGLVAAWLFGPKTPVPVVEPPEPEVAERWGTLAIRRSAPLPAGLPVQDILVGYFRSRREPTLFFPEEGKVTLVSLKGQAVDGRSDDVVFHWHRVTLADVDSDELCELFAGFQSDVGLSIAVYNQNMVQTKLFHYPSDGAEPDWQPSSSTNKIGLRHILGIDLNNDGRRELLCEVGLNRPPVGRGIWCFDYDRQTWRWGYLTGASLTGILAEDIDGDGFKEVILSSAGTSNGGKGQDGSDDATSRVYVLSHYGALRWQRVVGGELSLARMAIGDIDRDGRCDILAWEAERGMAWERPETLTNGMVTRLSASGEVIRSRNLGCSLSDGRVVDLDDDRVMELVVFDRNGNLLVLDPDLKERRRVNIVPRRYDRVLLRLVGVVDLTGDSVPEWVLTSSQEEWRSGKNPGKPDGESVQTTHHDNEILVLNKDFSILGRHRVSEKSDQGELLSVHLADCNGDGKPEILLLTHEIQVLTCRAR